MLYHLFYHLLYHLFSFVFLLIYHLSAIGIFDDHVIHKYTKNRTIRLNLTYLILLNIEYNYVNFITILCLHSLN